MISKEVFKSIVSMFHSQHDDILLYMATFLKQS